LNVDRRVVAVLPLAPALAARVVGALKKHPQPAAMIRHTLRFRKGPEDNLAR
jgi:hypothetical protein